MTRSVLIAEDEEAIVESLRFLMETLALRVRVATDGPAALRLARQEIPDLVLLDVMMPGCDGFEVARAIRADPRCGAVRIVMLTAKNREIDRRKAEALGVDAFVTKPFSTREMVARVRALLDLPAD